MNKTLEKKEIDVLKKIKQMKVPIFFGRSEYMTSVIFDGNYQDVGNIIKLKLTKVTKILYLVIV